MKYGFSTLGCPDWPLDEIITAASDLGYDGIELRGIQREIYLPRTTALQDDKIPDLVSKLERLGLKIQCLTSSAFLFDPSLSKYAQLETEEYINLAVKLGAPYVRLLADRDTSPGVVDEQTVLENLDVMLPAAEKAGVTLLVETNGVYADSRNMLKLCEQFDSPAFGVLWDVHHPYRYFGETPETTYGRLSKYIKHIHVKDSRFENGKLQFRMMGYGDVPVARALDLLESDGFDGFIVLEWVKRWNLELEEPGIVFSHFLGTMNKK